MKKRFLLCLFFGSAFVSACAQTADEAAVKKVIDQETASYESGNYEAWANHWAHEPYVLWVINQPDGGYLKVTGWEALSKQIKEFMPDKNSGPKPTTQRDNYVIRQNGTMAFVTYDQGDANSPIRTRESRVLEKKGKDWKSIHSSVFLPWPQIRAASATTATTSTAFQKGTYATTAFGGKWAITFGDEGKFNVSADGQPHVEGTYKLVGDTLEVIDTKGQNACGATQTGKYKWALAVKTLTFTKVEDERPGRSNAYAQAWGME